MGDVVIRAGAASMSEHLSRVIRIAAGGRV